METSNYLFKIAQWADLPIYYHFSIAAQEYGKLQVSIHSIFWNKDTADTMTLNLIQVQKLAFSAEKYIK